MLYAGAKDGTLSVQSLCQHGVVAQVCPKIDILLTLWQVFHFWGELDVAAGAGECSSSEGFQAGNSAKLGWG